MDLQPISDEEIRELNRHTIPEQQLAKMKCDEDQAFAIDWNILTRKIDFVIRETRLTRTAVVEQDKLLQSWKVMARVAAILWVLITGSTGAIVAWLLAHVSVK